MNSTYANNGKESLPIKRKSVNSGYRTAPIWSIVIVMIAIHLSNSLPESKLFRYKLSPVTTKLKVYILSGASIPRSFRAFRKTILVASTRARRASLSPTDLALITGSFV